MSKCVLIGCALICEGMSVWGDLHEEGDCWIFNAVLTPQLSHDEEDRKMENRPGEARWQDSIPPDLIKQVVVHDRVPTALFERRGVIIIAKACADLNPAAKSYLGVK